MAGLQEEFHGLLETQSASIQPIETEVLYACMLARNALLNELETVSKRLECTGSSEKEGKTTTHLRQNSKTCKEWNVELIVRSEKTCSAL